LYNSLDLAINRRVFTLIEHILHEPVQLDWTWFLIFSHFS